MTTFNPVAAGGNYSAGATWVGGVAPGSADDVDLTGLTGTLSINGSAGTPNQCNNFTTGTSTGTLKWNGSVIEVYGNLTLNAGINISITAIASATLKFKATATGKTITTNNKTLPGVTFDGVGGGWQFQDNSTLNSSTSGITVTNGSYDDGGNTISTPSFNSNNTNTRSITMTGNMTGITAITVNATNLTDNMSGGTITPVTNSNFNMTGGNPTNGWGFLDCTNTHGNIGRTINDQNTFAALTITGSANELNTLTFCADQTITGNLTITGKRADQPGRLRISSNDECTPRTLTVNGAVSADNCDFHNINGAGSSAPWGFGLATAVGDYGGNNFLCTTAGTYYWVSGAGTFQFLQSPNANVMTSSGGSTPSRQPLPQDVVIWDNHSSSGGAPPTINVPGSVAGNLALVPGMNFDGTAFGSSGIVANQPTINFSNPFTLCGRLDFASAVYMTVTGSVTTVTITGHGTGNTFSITQAGQPWGSGIDFDAEGNTYQQLDDFTSTNNTSNHGGAAAFTGKAGTWDAQGFNTTFSGASAGISVQGSCCTVQGSGTFLISGATAANLTVSAGLFDYSGGTLQINGAGSTVTFSGGELDLGTFTRSGRPTTVAGSTVIIGAGGMTGSTLTISSGSLTDVSAGLINLSGAYSQTGGTTHYGVGTEIDYSSFSMTGGEMITDGPTDITTTKLTVTGSGGAFAYCG